MSMKSRLRYAGVVAVALCLSAPVAAQHDDLAVRSQIMADCEARGPAYYGYPDYDTCVEALYLDYLNHGWYNPDPPPRDYPRDTDPNSCNTAATRLCPR